MCINKNSDAAYLACLSVFTMYMYITGNNIASILSIHLRQLRKYFKEDIVRDLLTSPTAQAELEAEWQQLKEDRENLRSTFPTGNSRVRGVGVCLCACVHVNVSVRE